MKYLLGIALSGFWANSVSARSCNRHFLNNLTANYMSLACAHGIQAGCDIFSNYDNRSIVKSRKLEEESFLIPKNVGEVANVIGQLAQFATRRIAVKTVFDSIFWVSPAGGTCQGDAIYRENGEKISTLKWLKAEYVLKKEKPNECIADYKLYGNTAIESFFKLPTDESRVAVLKDSATCDYYSRINSELAKAAKEVVSGNSNGVKKGKSPYQGQR